MTLSRYNYKYIDVQQSRIINDKYNKEKMTRDVNYQKYILCN